MDARLELSSIYHTYIDEEVKVVNKILGNILRCLVEHKHNNGIWCWRLQCFGTIITMVLKARL